MPVIHFFWEAKFQDNNWFVIDQKRDFNNTIYNIVNKNNNLPNDFSNTFDCFLNETKKHHECLSYGALSVDQTKMLNNECMEIVKQRWENEFGMMEINDLTCFDFLINVPIEIKKIILFINGEFIHQKFCSTLEDFVGDKNVNDKIRLCYLVYQGIYE